MPEPAETVTETSDRPKARGFCTNPMPKQTKDSVQALYVEGVKPKDIASRLGIKYATVRTWINRSRWKQTKRIVTQLLERRPASEPVSADSSPVPVAAADDASNEVRSKLMRELQTQLAVLEAKLPKKVSDLATKRGEQGRAALVKTIAETAALVFPDWDTTSTGVIIMGELRGSRDAVEDAKPVIELSNSDVSAAPTAEPSTPQVVVEPVSQG